MQNIGLVLAVAIVTYPLYLRMRVFLEEKRKTDHEIKVINLAASYVRLKMKNGDYANRPMESVIEDFEFYRIAFYDVD